MAQLYPAARASFLPNTPSAEDGRQRQWRTEACRGRGNRHRCSSAAYDDRLYDLAVAALFSAHDAAIAELQRQNAKSAEVYEAIWQYATISDPAKRTQTVARTIAPAYAALKIIPATDEEGIHAPAEPQPLFKDIPDATAAAASDEAFSTFLAVASAYGYDGRDEPLRLPCAAIIRRPGLLGAIGSRFGGAIDGSLPQADCADVLPPTPAFDHLVDAAEKAQPSCSGTIRFSLGKDYELALTALRLHRLTDAAKQLDVADDAVAARFVARKGALVAAAERQLSHSYAAYFAASPRLSRRDAVAAVRLAVAGAYQLCE